MAFDFTKKDLYKACTWEDIKEDIKANHPEYAEILKPQLEAAKKPSFLKIKKDYYDKYYPASRPTKKPGKMTLD